nr:hypothetical protein CFP56_42253 [Quercus suber]
MRLSYRERIHAFSGRDRPFAYGDRDHDTSYHVGTRSPPPRTIEKLDHVFLFSFNFTTHDTMTFPPLYDCLLLPPYDDESHERQRNGTAQYDNATRCAGVREGLCGNMAKEKRACQSKTKGSGRKEETKDTLV